MVAPLQVDLVLMPATTGDFGVMPGHVPTVAQLRWAHSTPLRPLQRVQPCSASWGLPGGRSSRCIAATLLCLPGAAAPPVLRPAACMPSLAPVQPCACSTASLLPNPTRPHTHPHTHAPSPLLAGPAW